MDLKSYKLAKNYTDKKTGLRRKIRVSKPAGFTWNAPINIYTDGLGNFETDFDVSVYKPTATKTYYVNNVTGSDTNSGTSPSAPLKSVWIAVTKSDVDAIIITGGLYDRLTGLNFQAITRNISIIGNGLARISHHDFLTWTLVAGKTKTYQANRSNANKVIDLSKKDANGDYIEYVLKTSIDEVEATAGSYFISGSTVYIHSIDDRAPDNNSAVLLNGDGLKHVGNKTIYLENIEIIGGYKNVHIENTATETTPKIYAKNCKFSNSLSGNGLHIYGAEFAFLQDCEVSKSFDDGFNYHIANGVRPKVIEVNCIGRHNGVTGDNDNGSTMHDGGKIIRLNGAYFGNKGPNVADVVEIAGSDTESWNVKCVAAESKATDVNFNTGFHANSPITERSKMWLDECVAFNQSNDIAHFSGADVAVRNVRIGTKNGGGTYKVY